MAAKFTISSRLFLLLIAFQNGQTSQLGVFTLPLRAWCMISYIAPEHERYAEVVIDLEAIAKALNDKGYTTASNLLEKDLGAILDVRYNLENGTTIIGNATIFVPRDDAFKNRSSINFRQQTVRSLMLDREALCSPDVEPLVVIGSVTDRDYIFITGKPDDCQGHNFVKNVTITDWDIYHNGGVVVHGVDDFFHPSSLVDHPPPEPGYFW